MKDGLDGRFNMEITSNSRLTCSSSIAYLSFIVAKITLTTTLERVFPPSSIRMVFITRENLRVCFLLRFFLRLPGCVLSRKVETRSC